MADNDISVLDTLTDKQREVLDLLIEHKTSKEIARELGISPHTVDQRVQFAKEKLGVDSRSEAAVEYRRLMQLCRPQTQAAPEPLDQGTHEGSRSAENANSTDLAAQWVGDPLITLTPPEGGRPDKKVGEGAGFRVVPEMFEGRYGTMMRLGAIVVTTVLLLFIALGGVAIFDSLSRGFAG
jgi:DNA-binding CsgD family transcriptional regulator